MPPIATYEKWFSARSLLRKPSAIRALLKYLSIPGMISLGGGNPHPGTFPFLSMQFTLRNGEVVEIGEEDMKKALQYSATNGLPDLTQILRELQNVEHQPQHQDFEICVGNGSQDVLTKAFDALLNEGDYLLIDSPAYVGSLAFLKPLGVKFAEISQDGDGLIPEQLEETLKNWPDTATRPKVLYTVPVGANPSGSSTTFDRKTRVYELAQVYDLLILEDDPYYYLQFSKSRIPSYFSMDVDKRVLRFDSLSKILSAGIRIGWATGPAPLIERIALHGQVTTLHPSGMSQIVTLALLKRWGIPGFLTHADGVAAFYETKRDMFLKAAEAQLAGIAEWTSPSAGMFVWLKLLGIDDSAELIRTKAVENKVLLVPGFEFFPNPRVTPFVRASYSIASEKEIDDALSRLRDLVLEARKG